MNLKSPLILPIWYITGESLRLAELGIDDKEELELRDCVFYTIDHIIEYTSIIENKTATRIISSGMDYLVPMEFESLISLVNRSVEIHY